MVDPADYELVQAEIRAHGSTTLELRRRLAAKAFAYVAEYDSVIANWLAEQIGMDFPERRPLTGKLMQRLRYGENPHQSAAFYRTPDRRFGVATARQAQGKQLSYNNINDTDAAYECVAEFDPAAPPPAPSPSTPIRAASPRAKASSTPIARRWLAIRSRPTAASSRSTARSTPAAARAITEIFTEVIIAPDATEEAVAIVGARKNLRLLIAGGLPDPRARRPDGEDRRRRAACAVARQRHGR